LIASICGGVAGLLLIGGIVTAILVIKARKAKKSTN
jgi:hypothetical protein